MTMLTETTAQLLALNRQFYQTFALQFSETRQRLQPGVYRILTSIPEHASILDLGCGNGELARELGSRKHQGRYVGLDFSPELLMEAKKSAPKSMQVSYVFVDLASPDWPDHIKTLTNSSTHTNVAGASIQPDYIFAFAVLHHLPGDRLRRQLLTQVRKLLSPEGIFVFSVWQFLNSERLRSRVKPWELVAIRPEDVEPSDYLLDWRRGGSGLRYVHHFSENELERLAKDTGFSVRESFPSDGEGNNLGLYQIWIPTSQV